MTGPKVGDFREAGEKRNRYFKRREQYQGRQLLTYLPLAFLFFLHPGNSSACTHFLKTQFSEVMVRFISLSKINSSKGLICYPIQFTHFH